MALVIDASIAGPLALPDERDAIDEAGITQLFTAPLLVPIHWRLEVANMLRTAIARGRLAAQQREGVLARLAKLEPEIDRRTAEFAWTTTLTLADRYGLTPYDAAYLELCARRDAALATLDRQLARAADAEGLRLMIRR